MKQIGTKSVLSIQDRVVNVGSESDRSSFLYVWPGSDIDALSRMYLIIIIIIMRIHHSYKAPFSNPSHCAVQTTQIQGQCCFTSTETVRTVRDGELGTSTETVRTVRDRELGTSTETVRTVRDGELRTSTETVRTVRDGELRTSTETVRTIRDGELRTGSHLDFNTTHEKIS